jgi:hypothetical protein
MDIDGMPDMSQELMTRNLECEKEREREREKEGEGEK